MSNLRNRKPSFYTCGICREVITNYASTSAPFCYICEVDLCKNCGERCDHCNKITCGLDTTSCSACDQPLCINDSIQCAECPSNCCRTCSFYRWTFCKICKTYQCRDCGSLSHFDKRHLNWLLTYMSFALSSGTHIAYSLVINIRLELTKYKM